MYTIDSEMVASALMEGIFNVVEIAMPYLISIIAIYITLRIIKYFISRTTYYLSIVSGCTHRQATRRAKKAVAVVDILSVANDLKGYTKQ